MPPESPKIDFARAADLNIDGDPMMEFVVTNLNDGMTISLEEGALIGRAPGTGRGPAINVFVAPPLYLELVDEQLVLRIGGEVPPDTALEAPIYETVAAASAASVGVAINAIQTLGYYAAGDGGGATYKRVAAVPYHSLYIQSSNGVYWEYVPGESLNAKVAGIKGDGVTDDWLGFMQMNKFMKLYGRSRKYTVTISIASPAVVTLTAHGFRMNDAIWFSTTEALPTGIVAGRPYFIRGTGFTKNSFQIAERQAYIGADPFDSQGDGEWPAVATSGAQSGTHSIQLSGVDPIVLTIPPGIYRTNQNFYLAGTVGVRSLRVKAHGAEFITESSGGASSGYNLGGGAIAFPTMISTGANGAAAKILRTDDYVNENNYVTLVNAGDLALFHPNQWIHIGCIDLQSPWGQFTSWPPNNHLQEFAQIWSIDAGTKQLFLQNKLKQRYQSHYPEPFSQADITQSWQGPGGGPGMIRPMSAYWDVELTFEGGHFMSNNAGGQQIGSMRKLVMRDCVFEISEFLPQVSHTREAHFENCEFRSSNIRTTQQVWEADKQVELVRFFGCSFGALNLQSTSIEKMVIDSCDIYALRGTVKNVSIRNSTVREIYYGPGSLGSTESLLIESSHFNLMEDQTYTYQGKNSGSGFVEDWAFSNGVLSRPMADDVGRNWMVPGRLCHVTNWADTDGVGYYSMGAPFTILDIWKDASDNFCVHTTLKEKPAAGSTSATVTISIASPAVVSWAGHGLVAGTAVLFQTTGALPGGINVGPNFFGSGIYYVIASGLAAGSFQISASRGGAPIGTSGTQSGTHTGYSNPLFYEPSPCQNITVRDCTGSGPAVEYSRAPDGLPVKSYCFRRYEGGDQTSDQGQYVDPVHPQGRVVQIIIDVRRAYTGTRTANLTTATLSGIAFNEDLSRNDLSLVINPQIAGKRVITPAGVTGAQSGDTLTATSVWLGRTTQFIFNSFSENSAAGPIIDVEILTDQGAGAHHSIFTPQRPSTDGHPEVQSLSKNTRG